MIPFVDLQAQYRAIKEEVDAAIGRVISNTSFILGKEVASFEEAFGGYIGAPFCVGVSNGTAAIQLALTACGLGAGDEVIVPANTFFATAEAVSTAGATPVFVRSEEHTSELQSRQYLVCRLLLEKKKTHVFTPVPTTPKAPFLNHYSSSFSCPLSLPSLSTLLRPSSPCHFLHSCLYSSTYTSLTS